MNYRLVCVSAQSILELFKDYLGDAIPGDAKVIAYKHLPHKNGKIAIRVASHDWTYDELQKPVLDVHFDIRRGYVPGGLIRNGTRETAPNNGDTRAPLGRGDGSALGSLSLLETPGGVPTSDYTTRDPGENSTAGDAPGNASASVDE